MQTLFSPDSRFMQAMSRIGDLLLLNGLFLISCVPVVTIGAAVTALYTVCFRFGTQRETGLVKSYFQAFCENFRQATALWLILLLWGGCAGVNVLLFYGMGGMVRFAALPFGILLVLALFMAGLVFPLLSQFHTGTKDALKNSLILSLGYLPRSVLVTGVNMLPLGILLTDTILFFQLGFVWVALYFSAGAWLNCLILKKVFAPYQTE